MAQMALQPSYGRLYMCFPLSTVFCVCVAIFGAGSIICATSPNSIVFITGRAVQGTGAAGVFSGALIICNYMVSKEKLPIFVSIISSMYIVASVMGPTVGGVIASSSLTWRFCFWLNLRKFHPRASRWGSDTYEETRQLKLSDSHLRNCCFYDFVCFCGAGATDHQAADPAETCKPGSFEYFGALGIDRSSCIGSTMGRYLTSVEQSTSLGLSSRFWTPADRLRCRSTSQEGKVCFLALY